MMRAIAATILITLCLVACDDAKRIADDSGAGASAAVGHRAFGQRGCAACHEVRTDRTLNGPSLAGVGQRLDADALAKWIREPRAMKPDTKMPGIAPEATDGEVRAIVAYLQSLPAATDPMAAMVEKARAEAEMSAGPPDPDLAAKGKRVFQRLCFMCHRLDGTPSPMGPSLDGVANRLSASDLREWVRDPKARKPETHMPAWTGSDEDLARVLAFLATLRTP
ncbi:MAG: cytochrome c [Planctomycetota bacterium]